MNHFLRACICSLFLVPIAKSENLTIQGHVKPQANVSFAPPHSLQRNLGPDITHLEQFDIRLNSAYQSGKFRLSAHGEALGRGGTAYEVVQDTGNLLGFASSRTLDDERRFFDLSARSVSAEQFESFQRLDRAEVGYYGENTTVRLGRQALTFGNGLTFQTLDLFTPFSPIEIDKDYKSGDDVLYVEQLFQTGQSLELLALPRRDQNRSVQANESSFAAILSGSINSFDTSYQLLGAEQYGEWNFGLGTATDISESVFRADVLLSRTQSDSWRSSFVTNLDTSWVIFGLNAYTYIEYYRNGFGIGNRDYTSPSPDLLERRSRGELFVLGRDLLVLGGRLQLSPLVNVFANQITHLNDGSGFHQLRVQYDMYQSFTLNAGLNLPYGSTGTEFGGIPVTQDDFLRTPQEIFLRLSYFFSLL